jgi:hypothetical protein
LNTLNCDAISCHILLFFFFLLFLRFLLLAFILLTFRFRLRLLLRRLFPHFFNTNKTLEGKA